MSLSQTNLCIPIGAKKIFFDLKKFLDCFSHAHHMRKYWFHVKNHFQNFHKIFIFWDPLNQKKRFLRKCLSVGRIFDNSRQNYRIELSFGILNQSRKSKDKFVNQSHPTKIVKIGSFFVFLKFFVWKNPELQY